MTKKTISEVYDLADEPINQQLIDTLQALLDDAFAGRLKAMAWVTIIDNKVTDGWMGLDGSPMRTMSLIGATRVLERNLMDTNVRLDIDPATGYDIDG